MEGFESTGNNRIVQYFLNGVDHLDQFWSTNVTVRSRDVFEYVFTFLLDASVHNELAIFNELRASDARIQLQELKSRMLQVSVTPLLEDMEKRKAPRPIESSPNFKKWMNSLKNRLYFYRLKASVLIHDCYAK